MNGSFTCNAVICEYSSSDLRNLNEHRAIKHGFKSEFIGKDFIERICRISNCTIYASNSTVEWKLYL